MTDKCHDVTEVEGKTVPIQNLAMQLQQTRITSVI